MYIKTTKTEQLLSICPTDDYDEGGRPEMV